MLLGYQVEAVWHTGVVIGKLVPCVKSRCRSARRPCPGVMLSASDFGVDHADSIWLRSAASLLGQRELAYAVTSGGLWVPCCESRDM
jgi:hypothetical protein